MFDRGIEVLERAFVDVSVRRLTFVLFVFALVLFADYVTGFSVYYRTQQEVAILKGLSEIPIEGENQEARMRRVYNSVLSTLESRQQPLFEYTLPGFGFMPRWAVKGFGGIWILLLALPVIYFAPGQKNVVPLSAFLFVSGVFIALFGLLSILIPTVGSVYVNVLFCSVAQLMILFWINSYGREKAPK